MATIPEALKIALEHHRHGRFQAAEAIYRQILAVEPTHADAWHLLGVVSCQMGAHQQAAECIGRALQIKPDFAEALGNLGIVMKNLGQLDEAIRCYRQALQLKPDSPESLNNLGIILKDQGHLEEAADCYQRALQLKAGFAEAHSNLGIVLKELGRLDEAAACYQRALQLKPNYPEAHNNLGIVLRQQGRAEDAAACYQRAIQLKPAYAEAHNNLGIALRDLGRPEEAQGCHQQAVQLNPDYAEAHSNLGTALRDQGRHEEAIACYRQAVQLKPDYADAHLNLGLTRLLLGELERGWPEYAWRWRTGKTGLALPQRPQPAWTGQSLAGRTILLYAEQGLGDTIHFVRYAPLVRRLGARVIVACQKPLLPLLATCPGIDQLVAQDADPPAFDFHASLQSAAAVLTGSVEAIPAPIPYLTASPALVDKWRQRLGATSGLKIGINWKGSADYHGDRQRSIPLRHFTALAGIPGISLISLQKGAGTEELAALREQLPIVDLAAELDRDAGAFMDTAAVIKNLDLVITADTSIGHLAGALGVPFWLALAFVPDWRWFLERQDSPWYPSARLFRQASAGDWPGVFAAIRATLCQQLGCSAELPAAATAPAKPAAEAPKPEARAAAPRVDLESKPLVEDGHVRVKRCRHGVATYLLTDQYIGRSMDRYGEFSEGEVELFRQIVQPGWTVLEIGANIGTHTVPLAKAAGPQGAVYALEPQRVLFQMLCANVALNALSNVYTYHAAAGRQPATIAVPRLDYAAPGNFGGISVGQYPEGERVPLVTVDSLNLPACHLLKIDVEGMEGEVIAGAVQTIQRFRPVLYVENDRDENSAALIRQVLGLGYRLYWHLPPLFNPRNFFGVAENIFPGIVSVNMLGIHTSLSQNVTGMKEITSPEARWS